MPFTQNQGAKIYWDEQGEGAPLLLIMGLGWTSHMWYRSRPVLAANFRTIAFDNRGVGQSDVPRGPYPIAWMASDAAAVLTAAGVEGAHICGMSMGGMIAQEFALQYPQRVRSLILGCTAPGGPNAVQADREVLDLLLAPRGNPEEMAKAIYPYMIPVHRTRGRKKTLPCAGRGFQQSKATSRNCKASWPGKPMAVCLRLPRPRLWCTARQTA